ncbi:YkgJ family cysteine cluster protein [Thioalbus denitrificans]|uniref:Putative zinc-or iron-chelating protein n=1 Tax=Thioalbus denitrificans TaxID=547122 RepID=A0A369CEJ9_9GAMM|nr:YkgJ family cysteine cluster protein [Thioalbus denitrificans]RCX31116.1 putative zinc- or iron-chelating protein [Thioalbus denitrificans]
MAEPFDIRLRVGGETLRLSGEADATPVRLAEVLPLLYGISDALGGVAEREVAARGRTLRCGPGCGACCRQLVPVAGAEAEALAEYVAGLEPDRRRALEARFAAARERLGAAGLLARLQGPPPADPAARRALGLAYFALGLACPFLEAESCSIHARRPAACREYLVTSDPAWCAEPERHPVEMVAPPRRVSRALYRLSADEWQGGAGPADWLPLVLALERPAPVGPEAPRRPAAEHLRRFLAVLAEE